MVLQQQSMMPVMAPQESIKNAKKLTAKISPQAKPVFFMTWAREKKPDMINALDSCYTEMAREKPSLLAPVGRAWQLAKKEQPDIKLYKPDGSHPNVNGTYLAACVILGTINGGSLPDKLGNGGLTEVTKQDAAFLRTIAKKVLQPRSGS